MKLIDFVERIDDERYDTWVCVEPKCGIEYTEEQAKQIQKEILEIVNAEQTDLFMNKSGEKRFKCAFFVCECGLYNHTREHWIVTNDIIKGW